MAVADALAIPGMSPAAARTQSRARLASGPEAPCCEQQRTAASTKPRIISGEVSGRQATQRNALQRTALDGSLAASSRLITWSLLASPGRRGSRHSPLGGNELLLQSAAANRSRVSSRAKPDAAASRTMRLSSVRRSARYSTHCSSTCRLLGFRAGPPTAPGPRSGVTEWGSSCGSSCWPRTVSASAVETRTRLLSSSLPCTRAPTEASNRSRPRAPGPPHQHQCPRLTLPLPAPPCP
ncbi:hypothetical protein V8C86DRAFT_2683064, partial [Haematococcus lacustris]